jgi:ATP-binding cassette subfamily F protein uup
VFGLPDGAAGPGSGPGADAGPATPWEADPRARAIMAELLPGIGTDVPAAGLSGGERRRVALASLLASERDVLLLDEPTNHLDIEAIDWLGRHLRDRAENRHCAVVVVSHDRWLLDYVCERTWEVDRGQVHAAEGGYSAYVLAQAERERSEEVAERRRRNLARKELAWLQRGAKARTTKAKFRVDAATALIAAEPPARDTVELTRMATARLGKTVIELEDVSASVGQRTLLDRVTWRLGPGDRIGMVGVNGSGKTSLLRVLADEAPPGGGEPGGPGLYIDGTVITGKTVRLAHLSQELAELDPDQRVREAVEEIRLRIQVGDRELSAGQLLERLGFAAERQWTRIGDLSGGERRRVQMLRLLMAEPNVLLLDEPTNDLDIETLTELEDLLDGWPGTLVVVSHDRYFLERVTEHVVALLGDGKLAFLAGGVDEYLDRVRAVRIAAIRGGSSRSPVPAGAPDSAPGTAPGGPPRLSAAEERSARKELQRLERQLDRASAREAELGAQLAAHATDYEKLTALGADLKAAQAEKADIEERWLTVAADLES